MRLKVSALPKNPSLPHHIVRRNIRGCRGSSPAARGSRDEARAIADKHVIFGNSFYEPLPIGGFLMTLPLLTGTSTSSAATPSHFPRPSRAENSGLCATPIPNRSFATPYVSRPFLSHARSKATISAKYLRCGTVHRCSATNDVPEVDCRGQHDLRIRTRRRAPGFVWHALAFGFFRALTEGAQHCEDERRRRVSVRPSRGIVRPAGEVGLRSRPVCCHSGR